MHLEIEYSALTHIFDPSDGVKKDLGHTFFFSESGHVAYQSKGKKCRPTCKQKLWPSTHSLPLLFG